MRGKAQRGKGAASPFRITPAYAGKSRLLRPARRLARDHPRVCGEKVISFTSPRAARGSPPRMRGKVPFADLYKCHHGITPAYAGKSAVADRSEVIIGDHPRVCGEKFLHIGRVVLKVGSPPRMRGKEEERMAEYQIVGITPAYAGKSGWHRCHMGRTEDHPRVCGEKSISREERC